MDRQASETVKQMGEEVPLRPRARFQQPGVAWFVLGVTLITLLAGGLRVYKLDRPSFWADELYSIRSVLQERAESSWRTVAFLPMMLGMDAAGADRASASRDAPQDWRALGINEFSARLGPMVVGVLSVPLLVLASRPIVGTRAALMAGVLLAISPWHLEWSQNARFYGQLFLFYNLAMLLYFHASRHQLRGRLMLAMVCLVLAFCSHPPGIMLGVVLAADWLWNWLRRKPLPLGALGWAFCLGAATLCVALLALDMFSGRPGGWERLQTQERSHSVPMLVAGTIYFAQPALIAFAALSVPALWRHRPGLTVYLLLAGGVPLTILAVMSALDISFVHVRYGFMALFPWLLLAAIGLDRLYELARPAHGRLFALAAAAVLGVALLQMSFNYYQGGEGFRSRWDEAFAHVAQHHRPGDRVFSDFTLAGRYYLQADKIEALPDTAAQMPAATDGRVWIVTAAASAHGSGQRRWLRHLAELHAYFDTRIEQPYTSIHVYVYPHGSAAEP